MPKGIKWSAVSLPCLTCDCDESFLYFLEEKQGGAGDEVLQGGQTDRGADGICSRVPGPILQNIVSYRGRCQKKTNPSKKNRILAERRHVHSAFSSKATGGDGITGAMSRVAKLVEFSVATKQIDSMLGCLVVSDYLESTFHIPSKIYCLLSQWLISRKFIIPLYFFLILCYK